MVKLPQYHGFWHCWRLLGRWLLVIALALGFAKTPLAYECLPQAEHPGTVSGHVGGNPEPCHQAHEVVPPAEVDPECCLVSIDHGVRGAEAGFVLSKADYRDAQTQPVITVDADAWLLPPLPRQHVAASSVRKSVPLFQPPYLITQRFRL